MRGLRAIRTHLTGDRPGLRWRIVWLLFVSGYLLWFVPLLAAFLRLLPLKVFFSLEFTGFVLMMLPAVAVRRASRDPSVVFASDPAGPRYLLGAFLIPLAVAFAVVGWELSISGRGVIGAGAGLLFAVALFNVHGWRTLWLPAVSLLAGAVSYLSFVSLLVALSVSVPFAAWRRRVRLRDGRRTRGGGPMLFGRPRKARAKDEDWLRAYTDAIASRPDTPAEHGSETP